MAKIFLEVTVGGVVTLPKSLRGDATLFEARLGEDGIIELVPQHLGPASQRWFWSERWQRMELELDADISAGLVQRFDDAEPLIEALDKA